MAEHIKSESRLGSTIYHNLETGRSQSVPWGFMDWVLGTFGVAAFCLVLAFFAALVRMLWLTS